MAILSGGYLIESTDHRDAARGFFAFSGVEAIFSKDAGG